MRKSGSVFFDRRPKLPKPLREEEQIKYLTNNDLDALFSAISDPEFADFCQLVLVTALRLGELRRLTEADVDSPSGHLKISAKQWDKAEARIPINSAARPILDKYVALSIDGRLFRFSSVDWVWRKFAEHANKAGLDEGLTFHSLRHTFGTTMVGLGLDLKAIQELMRHESIASTMVYAKATPAHLQAASETLAKSVAKRRGKS
jgi:integrase